MNEQTEQVPAPADVALMVSLDSEIDKRVGLALARLLTDAYRPGNRAQLNRITHTIDNPTESDAYNKQNIGHAVGQLIIECVIADGALMHHIHQRIREKLTSAF